MASNRVDACAAVDAPDVERDTRRGTELQLQQLLRAFHQRVDCAGRSGVVPGVAAGRLRTDPVAPRTHCTMDHAPVGCAFNHNCCADKFAWVHLELAHAAQVAEPFFADVRCQP